MGGQQGHQPDKIVGGHLRRCGQVRVHRMRDLVEIVADAFELQQRVAVERRCGLGRHYDPALDDQPFGQTCERQPMLFGEQGQSAVFGLGDADGDEPAAHGFVVGATAGHRGSL